MNQQLIVTFLGTNKVGILSRISSIVCEANCNILDSRQAFYGEDFSLTMILEGSVGAITRAELQIPKVCQELDLLSMMKRTKHHSKQHLEHLADVEFRGSNETCMMQKITQFFAENDIKINAFRQTSYDQDQDDTKLKCKMVVSMPQDLAIQPVAQKFEVLLQDMELTGSIVEKH